MVVSYNCILCIGGEVSERKYIKHLQNKNVEVISDYAEVVKENINLRQQINQLQEALNKIYELTEASINNNDLDQFYIDNINEIAKKALEEK